MKREFPFPIPNGWFQVAYSDELATGKILPLRYFGEDLVLLRTHSGQPLLFDAHCPHLGTHLAEGGSVVGETIQCPSHAWRFDAEGHCVGIPFATPKPPSARLRAWPVREQNGFLFAWRHALGEPPAWELPGVPELASEDWTLPERREWTVRSRNQELAENSVDQAHFKYVHGTQTVADTELRAEGHILHVVSTSKVETPRGDAEGRIEIAAHGFGFGLTRFKGAMETLVITSGTPIDEDFVHMRLVFSVRRLENADATRGVGQAFVAEIERQFAQDIPIWENKIHLPRPLLCDGDGPIGELRRWGRQFYTPGPPKEGEVTAPTASPAHD